MFGKSRQAAAPLALIGLLLLSGARADAQGTSSKGYIEMPKSEDGTYVLTHRPGSGRNWGTPAFVRFLVMVSREWKKRHPNGPILRIGDMSKPDGSNFPPHKTHKDGLTADLFTSPKNACHVRFPDQRLTLELAQLMVDLGARQILYNGDLVTKTIPIAKKWPKHDDHFHVVIDPSRVPSSGALLVLPEPGCRTGDWIGGGRVDEDGKGLILTWRVLGQAKLKSVRVQVDDADPSNGILHDSGKKRLRQPGYKLPLAVKTGQTLRWRVQVEVAGQEDLLESSWQTLQVDLRAPEVAGVSPRGKIDLRPGLRWSYDKDGVAQRRYWIELDKDPDHKRVWVKLGPFVGSATSAQLPAKLRLKRGKTYHWRVRVEGGHGNRAESDWIKFKTSSGYGKKKAPRGKGTPEATPTPPKGTVSAAALNLRKGPAVSHPVLTSLKRGTEVSILGERGGWLEVEARSGNKTWRGFVSAKYIRR
ncbi:MAG: penicillin-insensitive murein endopeptidase [Planctomycetes bacterium]|nr:penicillin-insensitive murein endopeptidase [Planctomycetota bacterium]